MGVLKRWQYIFLSSIVYFVLIYKLYFNIKEYNVYFTLCSSISIKLFSYISQIKQFHYSSDRIFYLNPNEWTTLLNLSMRIASPKFLVDSRLPTTDLLEKDATVLSQLIKELRVHKFFRIFKTDLGKKCQFWRAYDICTTDLSCSVCPCQDHEIPMSWKAKPIKNFVIREHYNSTQIQPWGNKNNWSSFIEEDSTTRFIGFTPISKLNQNFFSISDDSSTVASYVDLTLNPPTFTGYKGSVIWNLIYKENCIGSGVNPLERVEDVQHFTQCTEEEAFYKIISGMQLSIAIHSSQYHYPKFPPQDIRKAIQQYINKGKIIDSNIHQSYFSPSYLFFFEKVTAQEDWINNLYFTFGVLLRVLHRLTPLLRQCDCDTGVPEDDALAQIKLGQLLQYPLETYKSNTSLNFLFDRKHKLVIEQLRNISRIVDCVECEKCRLHGKMKLVSLQIVLKALSQVDYVRSLERNEIIALLNTLGYFADSIVIFRMFKRKIFFFHLLQLLFYGVIILFLCLLLLFLSKKRSYMVPKKILIFSHPKIKSI